MKYVLHNGVLISAEDAHLPISRREVLFSFGIYESLKVRDGVPLFVEEHLERLAESARILDLQHSYDPHHFIEAITRLVEANELDEATLRIQMFGGDEPFYYVVPFPLPRYPYWYYQEGVPTISYEGERVMPRAKSNCLLLNYIALREAQRQNAVEALLVNRDGNTLEGTRSNLYAYQRGVILTPERDVLYGVTRKHILEWGRHAGYRIEYTPLPRTSILNCEYEGLFISSTSMGAVPVHQVDAVEMPSLQSQAEFRELITRINAHLNRTELDEIEKAKK
ncbi:MAG: aminotransferase class IV [Spirochaetia bacterium]